MLQGTIRKLIIDIVHAAMDKDAGLQESLGKLERTIRANRRPAFGALVLLIRRYIVDSRHARRVSERAGERDVRERSPRRGV